MCRAGSLGAHPQLLLGAKPVFARLVVLRPVLHVIDHQRHLGVLPWPSPRRRAGTDRKRWYAGKDDDEDTEADPATHRGDERYDPALASWGDVRGGGSHARIY